MIKLLILKWYISHSNIKRALAKFLMTLFMIHLIDLKSVKTLRDKLVEAGCSKHKTALFWDILFTNLIYGFDPSSYGEYGFANKSLKDRLTFFSYYEKVLFAQAVNLKSDSNILDKKNKTYESFKKYFNRDQIIISGKEDYKIYCDFIEKHPLFFYKPYDGACGQGAGIANSKESDPKLIFNNLIGFGKFVLEELIVQTQKMSELNPSSINTVRTVMFRTNNGPEMLFAEIRCGRLGSVVDNGGAGGILVPCDINTGVLCKTGFDATGKTYTCHPDTKVSFNDFKIQRWDEIVDLSKKLMDVIPNLNYAGWDIAITDNGLSLVEGNNRPMFGGLQGLHKTGFKKEILEMMNNNKISENFRTKQRKIFQC